jgi:hypothetical protein
MLADVVFDAPAKIQHHPHEFPNIYAPFAGQLDRCRGLRT